MQLEQDNTGQLIVYTGVYPGEHPIPSALALALVRDFADSITRVTDPDVYEVHDARTSARKALMVCVGALDGHLGEIEQTALLRARSALLDLDQ